MKFKITLCLKALAFLLLMGHANAQSQLPNTDFADRMNHVFQHLEKNRVPHGILMDFGLEYVDMTAYNGTLTTDNHTTRATVHETFYSLISSRIRQVNAGFMQPQNFEKLWRDQRSEGLITLGGLYFKYSKFKDDAETSGKVTVLNDQVYDVYTNGVWQNPYDDKALFVMAPSVNSHKGFSFDVKLPQNIFLSNYAQNIQSIAVDFQDGQGYRTIGYNQTLSVSYNQANTYTWKFKLTLTNNQQLHSHAKVTIEEGLKTKSIATLKTPKTKIPAGATTQSSSSDLDVYFRTTVTATVPYYGKYGKATLYIRDAGGDDQITKPLIVAEGFDTGVYLNPEQEAGDNNIEKFLEDIEDGGFSLDNEIDTYDIIYVDWNNGVDFIQRNAYALEAAIKWVNDSKTSDTPNIVLGQSMGGLAARYALADIEQNRNFNHDTQLYISHDAPNLGANTPLGMQYMYRHVNNMYQSAPIPYLFGEVIIPLAYDLTGIYEDIINSFGGNVSTDLGEFVTPGQYFSVSDFPASRQMLYNWVNTDYDIKNAIHDAWQAQLTEIGYPEGYPNAPIRNIAIANGSECGTTFEDGSLIRYEKTAADKTVLNSVIGITDIGVGLALTGTWQGLTLVVLGILPGNSKYDIIFNSSMMNSLNANKRIYYGRITYKKKILWFIPVTVNLTRVEKNQPSGKLPYEAYGGGAYTIENYIGQLLEELPTLENNGTFGRYGFIPTASALDIGSGTVTLNDSDYRREYAGANPPLAPKNTPFENFVSHFNQFDPSNNNSEHISFNRRNGDWLTEELLGNNGIADNCTFVCDSTPLEIIGTDNLCGTAEIYTINVPYLNYTWQIIEGHNLVTISGSGESITLTPVTDYVFGDLTLQLTFGNQRCGNRILTKTIRVGDNDNVDITGLEDGIDAGDTVMIELTNTNGCGEIYFTHATNATFVSVGDDYAYLSTSPSAQGTGSIYVSITGTNSVYKEFPIHNDTVTPPNPPNVNLISIARIENNYNVYPYSEWKMVKAYYYGNSGDVDYWEWSMGSSYYSKPNDSSIIFLPSESSNITVNVRACNSGGCSTYASQVIN